MPEVADRIAIEDALEGPIVSLQSFWTSVDEWQDDQILNGAEARQAIEDFSDDAGDGFFYDPREPGLRMYRGTVPPTEEPT